MNLLDTDIVIDALAGDDDVRNLIAELTPSGVSISSITLVEVAHELSLRGSDVTRDRFDRMLREVPVISFGRDEANECATIRANLQREGKPVRSSALDLMIAAIALSHGLALVTRYLDDY